MAEQAVQELIDRTAEKRNGDDFWYIDMIIGLAALGRGELCPLVYKAAVALCAPGDHAAKQRVWVRVREALLKSTFPTGQWKTFSAEAALFATVAADPTAIPTEKGFRGDWVLDDAAKVKAEDWLKTVYGPEMAAKEIGVSNLLAQDIGDYVRVTMAYVFAEDRILNLVETERIITMSLVCQDVATLSALHAKAIVKLGGTPETAHEVVNTALAIGEALGITLKGFPSLDAILQS